MTSDDDAPRVASEVDLTVLSEREREVLDTALGGESVRDLAARLSLSEATVRSHLAHIYDKLGVTGRVELLARMNGHQVGHEGHASEPPLRRRSGSRMPATVGAVLILLLALFAWWRPDLQPNVDGDALMELGSSGQVAAMEVHGERVSLTTADGRQLRADHLDGAVLAAVVTAIADHDGTVAISPADPMIPWWLILGAAAVAPVGLLAILGLLAVRWIRTKPRPPAMPPMTG
jgi:DNA-binding CsgD family transcriptional regulator